MSEKVNQMALAAACVYISDEENNSLEPLALEAEESQDPDQLRDFYLKHEKVKTLGYNGIELIKANASITKSNGN